MPHDALDVPPMIWGGEQSVRFVQNEHVELGASDRGEAPWGEEEGGQAAGSADEDIGGLGEECLVGGLGAGSDQEGKG